MGEKKLKVLIVDDEKVVRDFLTRILSLQPVEHKAVDDGFKAIEAVKNELFDLVFLDIRMPKMDGLKVYGELKKINPELNCVFMTGYALEESLLDKTKQPGIICLKKPFQDINQIKEIINSAMKKIEVSPAPLSETIQEKRAYSRLSINLEVDYKVIGIDKSYGSSLTKDISPGGLRLVVEGSLACGTILELTIKTPGTGNTCKARAVVVWSREITDKPGYFEAGVKFKEISLSELTTCINFYNEFYNKGVTGQ